jgi:hypothetical protein
MQTTCEGPCEGLYIGADLTDGYANARRPIDVCGLAANDGKLRARFWQWTYDDGIINVAPLLPEICAARGSVLDGPQALAQRGASMRECERILGAPGHTPDVVPQRGPFSGFIRTSVELFAAFHGNSIKSIPISAQELVGGVGEHYPGGNWNRLVGRLHPKTQPQGVKARRLLLEALGVVFPGGMGLTHDHLDACLGAVIAAAADNRIEGACVERCGLELRQDDAQLREGPILLLTLNEETRARLAQILRKRGLLVEQAPQAPQ